jgi:hypothetical protein
VNCSRGAQGRRRWLAKLAGVAAALACLSSCSGGGGPPACHPGINAAESWIVNGAQLQLTEASEAKAVRYAFRNGSLFVLESPGKVSRNGQTVAYFSSYQHLKLALEKGGLPPSVRWVMYDNERWKLTPLLEQKNPQHYMTLFANLAHRHGYKVILAPAQDLVFGYRGPGFRETGTAWQRYISAGLAAAAARVANIYEIQAQSDELPSHRASSAYQDFVRAAVKQARAANSHITIFAGVSTKRVTSAAQLYQDFRATRALVTGYWLNIPGRDPTGLRITSSWASESMAGRFLQQLPAAAAANGGSC